VYKASYNGREVAVKVIEHNTDALPAVENEVSLMLKFNHDNVVRAFYCVTYTQTCSSSGNGGPGSTGERIKKCSRFCGIHHDTVQNVEDTALLLL